MKITLCDSGGAYVYCELWFIAVTVASTGFVGGRGRLAASRALCTYVTLWHHNVTEVSVGRTEEAFEEQCVVCRTQKD